MTVQNDRLGTLVQMVFMQVKELPQEITRVASMQLLERASNGIDDLWQGAHTSAASLTALNLLSTEKMSGSHLLDLYFESKTKLILRMLNDLQPPNDLEQVSSMMNAEVALSRIVLVLQYDALLHPYLMFCLGSVDTNENALKFPVVDTCLVQSRCSKFMATHLPVIRAKVQSVLVSIAGTTASALGKIRQSLYDQTDGVQSMAEFNKDGLWDRAIAALIDRRVVVNGTGDKMIQKHGFSLWNTLFSNAFSSLVHSLLTTSFQSVHTSVVSKLKQSLANAPPLESILPHDAHRNTLRIAWNLNESLLNVSNDAHELLVHAEERDESERRLRESLYVQTCEILGRLIYELRVLVDSDEYNRAVKEFVVGRLCYLLKHRLSSLPKLLNPSSSPAASQSTSYIDLKSAFDLNDDDEDGFITFDEALQAADSAFTGTNFRGAEMVRETLLCSEDDFPKQVMLDELVLLTARGLRHEKQGIESAIGAFQRSLDGLISSSLGRWACDVLSGARSNLTTATESFLVQGSMMSKAEWMRLCPTMVQRVPSVSPFIVSFVLENAFTLNAYTCPNDSDIESMGQGEACSTLFQAIRRAVLNELAGSFVATYEKVRDSLGSLSTPALLQAVVDVQFVSKCLQSNAEEFLTDTHHVFLESVRHDVLQKVKVDSGASEAQIDETIAQVIAASGLYLSGLLEDPQGFQVTVDNLVSEPRPLFHPPISSTRRFDLLPVPSDRTLHDLHQRNEGSEQVRESLNTGATGGSVVSSGLGFLSNMLKNR